MEDLVIRTSLCKGTTTCIHRNQSIVKQSVVDPATYFTGGVLWGGEQIPALSIKMLSFRILILTIGLKQSRRFQPKEEIEHPPSPPPPPPPHPTPSPPPLATAQLYERLLNVSKLRRGLPPESNSYFNFRYLLFIFPTGLITSVRTAVV